MGEYKYTAFISYSHKDAVFVKRLHRYLETYSVPKHLIGGTGKFGPVRSTLAPIFRDQDDLSVDGDLSQTILNALRSTDVLIVVCSPDAAQSRWVNEEILTFKRLARTRGVAPRIYPILVSGEPFASHLPRREHEECLPEALRFALGDDGQLTETIEEPLAADMRGNTHERRQGRTKLIAALLGVGLDEIVQRDLARQRRRVTQVTAGAAIALLTMGTLTGLAMDARKDAETRRGDAEGLIEFMLTDLKDELELAGRLDALKVVGEKAAGYYDGYALSDHDADALGRRARVFHFLGEVANSQADIDMASDYFNRAYEATAELLDQNPDSPDRIYDMAQSAFWRASPYYFSGRLDEARPLIQDYITLAERLNTAEPTTNRGQMEPAYAYQNMGILEFRQNKLATALALMNKSYALKKRVADNNNSENKFQIELSQTLSWRSKVHAQMGNLKTAQQDIEEKIQIIDTLLRRDPLHRPGQIQMASALESLADFEDYSGQTDKALNLRLQSIDILEELVQADPDNSDWALSLLNSRLDVLRSALEGGQLSTAQAHFDAALPHLEKWTPFPRPTTERTNYIVEQFLYAQSALLILQGDFGAAATLSDRYLSDSAALNLPSEARLTSGTYVYCAAINAILKRDPSVATIVLNEFEQVGLKQTAASQGRYDRTKAARDFAAGNRAALDSYLSTETSATLRSVFTALRDQ